MHLNLRFSALALAAFLAGAAIHSQSLAQSAATSSSSQAVAGAIGATGASVSQASASLRATTHLATASSATPLPLADGYQTVAAGAVLTGGAVTVIQGAASNVSQGAGTGSAQSTGSARALLPHTTVQGGMQGAEQYINHDNGGSVVTLPWATVSGGGSSQAEALLRSGTNGAAALSGGAAGTVNHTLNVTLTLAGGDVEIPVITPLNQSQNTGQPAVRSQSGSGQIVLPLGPAAASATAGSTATGGGNAIRQAF